MVNEMKTIPESSALADSRLEFIELLSGEFTARTGVGVYVYLTPVDINGLFKIYLSRSQTITIFIKQYVRSYSSEHNI